MGIISIDGITAKPGEKVFGFLEVGTTSVNIYRLPVAIINGVNEGKTLALLGGTHGVEFASIEAVIRTIKNADPKKMSGTILAVPVLNGSQFEHRSAFLSPFDQLNQSQQFPGDPEGTLSQRTAYVVFSKIVSKADALCDAHGGDITEDLDDYVIARQSDDEELNRIAIEMAKCFPAKMIDARNWRARANALGGPIKGLSAVAQDEFKIPCITSEAGCPYPVRERHVQFHYKGIQNLLKYFGIIEGTPELTDAPINPDGYRAKAKKGGIWWPKVEIGQKVDTGQELGYMQDLFGNIIEVYKSPQKGYVRFLRVWYSVNVGEPLVGVSYS